MKQTLELTVPELDCADEAQQIQAALSRLPGVEEVRTAVGARKAVVAYHPDRIQPDAIREAIRELGMTIADTRGPGPGRRRSLPDLLGWGFVSVVALVALVAWVVFMIFFIGYVAWARSRRTRRYRQRAHPHPT